MPKQMKKKQVSSVHKQSKSKGGSSTVHPPKTKSASTFNNLSCGLGTVAGGYFGGPLGAKLGGDAASFLSKITGMGDYEVSQNKLMTDNTPPTFTSDGRGILIKHREYLFDLNTPGAALFAEPVY
jgi:hypothetical protein